MACAILQAFLRRNPNSIAVFSGRNCVGLQYFVVHFGVILIIRTVTTCSIVFEELCTFDRALDLIGALGLVGAVFISSL